MKAMSLTDHVQNQDQIRREAEEMVQLLQTLKNEIEARREESKRLKMPDGEAALLRAAEAGVVCATAPDKKHQLSAYYLRGRGWKNISPGAWTHETLCPGALPQSLATVKQIALDLEPLKGTIEASLKAAHDRALGLNQHVAGITA